MVSAGTPDVFNSVPSGSVLYPDPRAVLGIPKGVTVGDVSTRPIPPPSQSQRHIIHTVPTPVAAPNAVRASRGLYNSSSESSYSSGGEGGHNIAAAPLPAGDDPSMPWNRLYRSLAPPLEVGAPASLAVSSTLR